MSNLFIRAFLADPSKENMSNLVGSVKRDDLNDDEILILAKGLADSGIIVDFSNQKICDIPSTGGPSSLTTLLCPLLLRIFGDRIIKIGVPGRPAGGIDVLAQINEYNFDPTFEELKNWFDKTGYVHILATKRYAPLDAQLFEFRKENEAVSVASLTIASILSKKIAAGLNYIGLDIRVSKSGNFGKSWSLAKENGLRFNRVAKLAGIDSTSFLSDGEHPFQPYIGRGESLIALDKVFKNINEVTLRNHLEDCFLMSSAISINKPMQLPSHLLLKEVFCECIIAQGGEMASFDRIVASTLKGHIHKLMAKRNGFLRVDMQKLRDLIVNYQNVDSKKQFPDSCGIILKKMPNEYINKGDLVCTYRIKSRYKHEFEEKLRTVIEYKTCKVVVKRIEIVN